jgi:hypothetical protein
MKLSVLFWRRGMRYQVIHYRKDPVPGTACYKASARSYYRRPQNTQVRRENCAPEVRGLVRGRRRKLHSAWDDVDRSNPFPKCWKDCTGKRKQWM